jgi:hypothetical protein
MHTVIIKPQGELHRIYHIIPSITMATCPYMGIQECVITIHGHVVPAMEACRGEAPITSHVQDLPVPSTTVRVTTTSFARIAATGVAAIVIQIISAVPFSLITISFGTAKEAATQRERAPYYTPVLK